MIYTKSFVTNHNTYRLVLYPYNSFDNTETAMENIIIKDNIMIKSNFEDDLPRGMELAKTLDLEIDLSNSSVLREIIMNGSSYPTSYEFEMGGTSISYYRPNVWKLQRYDGFGWVDKFIGTQTLTPSMKLESNSNYVSMKINIVEITKFILENITLEFIGNGFNKDTWNFYDDELYDADYYLGTDDLGEIITNRYIVKRQQFNKGKTNTIYFMPLTYLWAYATSYGSSLYNKVTNEVKDFIVENPYKNVEFYSTWRHDENTSNQIKELLDFDDIYFISHVWDNRLNKFVGGFLVDSENSGVKEFKTLWDLYKKMAENNLIKLNFDNSSLTYKSNAVFSYHKSPIELYPKKDNVNLEVGSKRIARSIVHFQDIRDGDIKDYEEKLVGTLNDASEETNLVFHNLPLVFESFKRTAGGSGGAGYQSSTMTATSQRLGIRRLYHFDGKFRKLHENSKLFFDTSHTIPSWGLLPQPYNFLSTPKETNTDIANVQWIEFIRRTLTASYPQRIGILYSTLFRSPKHAIAEIEVSNEQITCNDLGMNVTINPNNLCNSNVLDFLDSSAIIVSIEEDILKDSSKIKLFIRNDAWS